MPYCPECSASVPQDAERCATCGSSLLATPTDAEPLAKQQSLDIESLAEELAESLSPQYEVMKLLGAGGMGAVFLAREPALKRLVAVKILAPHLAADPKARARFEREARAAAALSHPNVVRVYAVGETKGTGFPFMIMQYVQGPTLAEWMSERGRVSERDARRVVGEVAAALAAAHDRHLVHRDVKPSNVLLETETGRAFVADFGVSAAVSPERQLEQTKLTATGTVVGTPIYMSPEQAAGEQVETKSDVYSLGMLAYELITGQLPFSASSTMGWVAAHMRDTPTPVAERRPEVSPGIGTLIDHCLAKSAKERPNAGDVARAMLPSIETEIEWPPPGLGDFSGWVKTWTRVLALTALAGMLLVLFVKITPDVLQAHPNWLARFELAEQLEGEGAAIRTVPTESGEASFLFWQSGIILGSAIFSLGFIFSIALIWRISGLSRQHRAAGWTWTTLVDVVADYDGQSGMILAGSRQFASLDDGRRRAILAARRRRTAFMLGAFGIMILAVFLWMIFASLGIGAHGSPAPLAGTTSWLFTWVPGTAVFVAAVLEARREKRLLGPVGIRRMLAIPPADVAEWYRTLPGGGEANPTASARGPRRFLRTALGAAAVLTVFVAVGAAASVLAASLVAARFVQRAGPRAAELKGALDRFESRDLLAAARPSWQRYLPPPRLVSDSALRSLVLSLGPENGPGALPRYDPAAIRLFPNDSLYERALREAIGGGLPPDTLEMLESLEIQPRTSAFRAVSLAAGAGISDALLEHPLESYGSVWWVPVASPARLRRAATANRLSALLEIGRGDRAAALRRIGENAAFAELLLREPVYLYNLVGLRVLQHDVLAPLAGLAEIDGDRPRAIELRNMSEELEGLRVRPLQGAGGLAADPEHLEEYSRVLVQYPLPAGLKAELIIRGWGGVCTNPWEILNGPSKARRDALFALADSLPFPQARALSLLSSRMLETPLGAIASGDEFSDLGLLEKTPLALLFRLMICGGAV